MRKNAFPNLRGPDPPLPSLSTFGAPRSTCVTKIQIELAGGPAAVERQVGTGDVAARSAGGKKKSCGPRCRHVADPETAPKEFIYRRDKDLRPKGLARFLPPYLQLLVRDHGCGQSLRIHTSGRQLP